MISLVMKTRYVHQYCRKWIFREIETNQSCCTALKSLFHKESLPSPGVKSSYLTVLIVNMLRPVNSKTFKDYASMFLPYIQSRMFPDRILSGMFTSLKV